MPEDITKEMNWPNLNARKVQDRILSILSKNPNYAQEKEYIKKIVFNKWQGKLLDEIFTSVIADLVALEYIEEGPYSIWITFKGKKFVQTSSFPYKGKPFTYELFKQRVTVIWNIIKVIAALINAVAIIYLAWLSISKQEEFNKAQLQLQIWQAKENERQAKENDRIERERFDSISRNSNYTLRVNEEQKNALFEEGKPRIKLEYLSMFYLSNTNSIAISFNYENVGKRDALNLKVYAVFTINGKTTKKMIGVRDEFASFDNVNIDENITFVSDISNKHYNLTLLFEFIDAGKSTTKPIYFEGTIQQGEISYKELSTGMFKTIK